MHLFVPLFSCYCVPNPIVGNIDMLYLLEGSYQFPLLSNPMCRFECASKSDGGLTRLLGPTSRVANPRQDFAFLTSFQVLLLEVQEPHFKNHSSKKMQ